MQVEFRKEFIANFKGIKNRDLADEIENLIDLAETIDNISHIPAIKKLKGADSSF